MGLGLGNSHLKATKHSGRCLQARVQRCHLTSQHVRQQGLIISSAWHAWYIKRPSEIDQQGPDSQHACCGKTRAHQ